MRMRSRTRVRERALLLAILLTMGAAPARPQQPRPPFPANNDPLDLNRDKDAAAERLATTQARAQSTERQKRLVADTDKLLTLATQLKEQVGKSDKNTLSLDVIKKAEEIEKLARSVKEKMKG